MAALKTKLDNIESMLASIKRQRGIILTVLLVGIVVVTACIAFSIAEGWYSSALARRVELLEQNSDTLTKENSKLYAQLNVQKRDLNERINDFSIRSGKVANESTKVVSDQVDKLSILAVGQSKKLEGLEAELKAIKIRDATYEIVGFTERTREHVYEKTVPFGHDVDFALVCSIDSDLQDMCTCSLVKIDARSYRVHLVANMADPNAEWIPSLKLIGVHFKKADE